MFNTIIISNFDPDTNYVEVTTTTSEEQFVKSFGDIPRLVFNNCNDPSSLIICEDDPQSLFKHCWKFDNNKKPKKVKLDLNRAKEVMMNDFRFVRNKLLDTWDKYHNTAIFTKDKKTLKEIETKKKNLRDSTIEYDKNVKNAKSAQDLYDLDLIDLVVNSHESDVDKRFALTYDFND